MAELILLVPIGYLAFASIPLIFTDIKEHRLPNRYTYPAITFSLLATAASAAIAPDLQSFFSAMACAGVTFGFGYLLAKFAGVGMGDVKLLTATNHLLGWFSPWLTLIALTLSFTLATLGSAIGMSVGKISWKTHVAMGPYLLASFFLVIAQPLASSFSVALSWATHLEPGQAVPW